MKADKDRPSRIGRVYREINTISSTKERSAAVIGGGK